MNSVPPSQKLHTNENSNTIKCDGTFEFFTVFGYNYKKLRKEFGEALKNIFLKDNSNY